MITINQDSFPFDFLDKALIPAVNAPVLFITPTIPPITSTNAIISIESYNPCTGAFKNVVTVLNIVGFYFGNC